MLYNPFPHHTSIPQAMQHSNTSLQPVFPVQNNQSSQLSLAYHHDQNSSGHSKQDQNCLSPNSTHESSSMNSEPRQNPLSSIDTQDSFSTTSVPCENSLPVTSAQQCTSSNSESRPVPLPLITSRPQRTCRPNPQYYYNKFVNVTTSHPLPLSVEPQIVHQDLIDVRWKEAMCAEYQALMQNET